MTRPKDRPLERQFWSTTHALGPTGLAAHVGAFIGSVLGGKWHGFGGREPADEQCAALLQQAKMAYEVVRDQAQARYAAASTTSARIRTIKAFAQREPLLVYDPWISDLKFEAFMKGDQVLSEGIEAALRPKLPTVSSGNQHHRIAAQEYYRWVIARTSEVLLASKKMTVSGAILWVVGLDEARERRKLAELTSGLDPEMDMEHRARQIYYKETKPYVWRVVVAAGVGKVGTVNLGQAFGGYQITGYHPRGSNA